MPYTDRLRAMDTTGGENTRSSRFEIESTQVRELVNLVPGKVATPRGGCRQVAVMTREVDWAFPFQDNAGSKISVGKAGVDLVQFGLDGTVMTIKAGAFPTEDTRPCAVRIGDSVLVGFDRTASIQAWVVTKKSNLLSARPANLIRPDSTLIAATHSNAAATPEPMLSGPRPLASSLPHGY